MRRMGQSVHDVAVCDAPIADYARFQQAVSLAAGVGYAHLTDSVQTAAKGSPHTRQ